MPSTIGKCKLFRIKHITLLEGEIFSRNKHEIAFFEIKCTIFGRKENTIRWHFVPFPLAEYTVANISFVFYLFINYNKITNYILIIYELSKFDHLLGIVSQTRVSGENRTHDPYTNGVFFSTKKCALYFKKCNFVFVSWKCFTL